MTNKRKQRARTLAEKSGMSYQAAINVLDVGHRSAETTTLGRSLQQLLVALRATSAFGIAAGRCLPLGRSASLDRAIEQARAAARPRYFAESTFVALVVSEVEARQLVEAGAAEAGTVQVIRSFDVGGGYALSEQCEACSAWIWCSKPLDGNVEVEGACVCGHAVAGGELPVRNDGRGRPAA